MIQPQLFQFGSAIDQWPAFRRLRREMNRALTAAPVTVEFPPINIWVGPDDAVLTIELPGVNPEKLELSIDGNVMRICGSRSVEEGKDVENYYRRERNSGSFTRVVQLPFAIEAARVEATYEKGILQIVLPRAEAEKPKKIAVKSE